LWGGVSKDEQTQDDRENPSYRMSSASALTSWPVFDIHRRLSAGSAPALDAFGVTSVPTVFPSATIV
jgi:hypothetical protein